MRRALWIVAPLCALVVAAALVYTTPQGRDWLDSVGIEVPESADPSPSASTAPTPTQTPAAQPLPDPPQPPVVPAVTPVGADPELIAKTLEEGLANKALGRHVVAAVAPTGGGDLLFRSGSDAVLPASTMKLLTAAAALESLGPDHTFETKVVLERRSGKGPRTLVLVGGGDPLLARKPEETYPARADVRTLAKQAAAALQADGVRRVRVRFDTSLFTGPPGSPTWRADYLTDDIVSPITALWVDQGREPSGFGRVNDPALAAGTAFAAALDRAGIAVVGAPEETAATGGAHDVASAESAPLSQIVEHVLEVSDNEGAEVLAHHVGVAVDGDGSFAGGSRGVAAVLTELGIPLDGAAIHDGSGLSRADRLTAKTLISLLQLVTGSDHPGLRAVTSGLPVAGFTGSLTYRFADAPLGGQGRVRAKTGTLTGVHGLAGVVTDQDGATYVFTIIADRVAVPRALAARLAIDDLSAALAACHCAPT